MSLFFFQMLVDLDASTVPSEVLKLKEKRGTAAATDCEWRESPPSGFSTRVDMSRAAVNFTEFDREPSGRVNLIGRVK